MPVMTDNADELPNQTPPEGFDLTGESSREGEAYVGGIVETPVDPEGAEDLVTAEEVAAESGDAADDDADDEG